MPHSGSVPTFEIGTKKVKLRQRPNLEVSRTVGLENQLLTETNYFNLQVLYNNMYKMVIFNGC